MLNTNTFIALGKVVVNNLSSQDRKPRNTPMHVWVSYFRQRKQEYPMGQRQPLQ